MDLGTPPKLGGEIFIFSLEVLFDTTAKISPPGSGGVDFYEERMERRGGRNTSLSVIPTLWKLKISPYYQ
jgi:hypothetical protein